MYCSRCGSPNADGARFCEKCGMTLGAAAAASASGSAPAASDPAPQWQPPPQQPPYYADPRMRGGATFPTAPGGKVYATGKSPFVAVLLSFFIPGVGQFYNGDAKKGGLMLGGLVLSIILAGVLIGIIGIFAVWIWSMVDAYNVASGKTPLS